MNRSEWIERTHGEFPRGSSPVEGAQNGLGQDPVKTQNRLGADGLSPDSGTPCMGK